MLAATATASASSRWNFAQASCLKASSSQNSLESSLLQQGSKLASWRAKHFLSEVPQVDERFYAERSLVADEGNGVGTRYSVSLDECKAACDSVPACLSFTYGHFSKACFMKDREVTMESATKGPRAHDWHFKTYFPVEPNSTLLHVDESDALPDYTYVERTLVAKEGCGVHTALQVKLAECKRLCGVHEACHSFTYSGVQQSCYLKKRLVAMEDAARVPQYLDYKTYIKVRLCTHHVCAKGMILRLEAESIHGKDDETCCLPRHSYSERTLLANEGHEVYAEFPVTLGECEKLCDLKTQCRSFAYSSVQRSCHLKHAAATMQAAARAHQYLDYKTYVQVPLCISHVCAEGTILRLDAYSIVDEGGETCCLPRHSYVERTLVAEEGHEVRGDLHVTLAECEKLCDLTGACRSFTYSALQQSCYLKHAAATMQAAARVPQLLDFKTYVQAPLCSNHACAKGMILLPNATTIAGDDDETCCEAS